MSAFEIIELSFDPEEAKPTLEDEFTMTMVEKDLEKLDNPEHLQIASKQLLKIIVHKQAMIRALCKRLVELEGSKKIKKFYFKG
tara:strand:+ start:49 stop:300 length:252 start_codon:yes stop_codon:yes gene_type:complete